MNNFFLKKTCLLGYPYIAYLHLFVKISKGNLNICIEIIEEEGLTVALVKCMRLLVQIVENKLRSLSSQMEQDLSIVGTVIRNINLKDFSN